MAASGNSGNYVITQFTNYGEGTYPNRFGVWREDLQGCIAYGPSYPNSHWTVVSNYGCRSGAQMIWNVQDGPQRMNNCNIAPNDFSATSKITVLDSAISTGLAMNMHYFELYQTDVNDPELDSLLTQKSIELHNHAQLNCTNDLSIENEANGAIHVYPNPFTSHITISGNIEDIEVSVVNQLGQLVYSNRNHQTPCDLILDHLKCGVYFVQLSNPDKGLFSRVKLIKY